MKPNTLQNPTTHEASQDVSPAELLSQAVDQEIVSEVSLLEVAAGRHPEMYVGDRVKMWALAGADVVLGTTAATQIVEALSGGEAKYALATSAIALMSFAAHGLGAMVERASIGARRHLLESISDNETEDPTDV